MQPAILHGGYNRTNHKASTPQTGHALSYASAEATSMRASAGAAVHYASAEAAPMCASAGAAVGYASTEAAVHYASAEAAVGYASVEAASICAADSVGHTTKNSSGRTRKTQNTPKPKVQPPESVLALLQTYLTKHEELRQKQALLAPLKEEIKQEQKKIEQAYIAHGILRIDYQPTSTTDAATMGAAGSVTVKPKIRALDLTPDRLRKLLDGYFNHAFHEWSEEERQDCLEGCLEWLAVHRPKTSSMKVDRLYEVRKGMKRSREEPAAANAGRTPKRTVVNHELPQTPR